MTWPGPDFKQDPGSAICPLPVAKTGLKFTAEFRGLAVAQRNLFAHLQIVLSTAVLLLIFVVKPVTVLGTPRAAQLKTSQLPAKVFHFLCYDSSNKLKQPKSHWSLLLPASAAEVQKSCRGGTGRVAQG